MTHDDDDDDDDADDDEQFKLYQASDVRLF